MGYVLSADGADRMRSTTSRNEGGLFSRVSFSSLGIVFARWSLALSQATVIACLKSWASFSDLALAMRKIS
jgi:hypothetical protein